MGKRCIVFDLDGTLADTSGDLIAAANARFEEMGLGPLLDPARDAGTALRGGRAMLRLGFSRVAGYGEADVDAQYQPLLDHYAAHLDVATVFYPGALEAVAALRARGDGVAICTNKPEGLAVELMRRLGASEAFDALVGADTLPVRKPDAAPLREAVLRAGGDPTRCLIVGDTETDLKTARALGCPCILVTFGPDPETIRGLAPDAWLDDYADLAVLTARLIP
ncbi:MAG: HAD-IA family hydrolase [Shimia sp.]